MKKTKPTSDMIFMRMQFQNLGSKYTYTIYKDKEIANEQEIAHQAVLDCLEVMDEAVDKLGVDYG
jgi:hypothetical protein